MSQKLALSGAWFGAWFSGLRRLGQLVAPPAAARFPAEVFRDAMRSANAAHGYPLALREAEAIAATALRQALQQGA